MALWIGIFTVVTVFATTGETARTQYEALAKEYEAANVAFIDAMNKASTDEDRAKAKSKRPSALTFAPRFFEIAEKHRDDPAAIESLTWIASRCMFVPEGEKALQILNGKYSESEHIAAYIGEASRYGEPFLPYEEFLRAVLKNNPHRKVQAAACVTLANYLKMAKEKSESNLIRIALQGERAVRSESLTELKRLKERGFDKVAAESEALFELVLKQYGDVLIENNYPQAAGQFAKEQLFELRNLSIGNKSLDIEGTDITGKPMKLRDYRGQVVVLDFGSHQTCGVCRQFYPGLRLLVEQLKEKPFALISINSSDDQNDLKHLVNDKEITWRMVWDGEAIDGPISSQWMIRSMPTFYVLDHKGVIRNKGFLQIDDIRGTIEMLLKEKELAGPKP